MPVYPVQFHPINILGEGSGPDWKIFRYPLVPTATETLDKMLPGFLVKFNAAGNAVAPALAADDALLGGVIVDRPDLSQPLAPGTNDTFAIAVQGTFNKNQVHYADAHTGTVAPLSAAALERLRTLNIFLDPAVPAGAFAP